MGHYNSVFWLDASSPTSLSLSLENVAAVVSGTKTGTIADKLAFLGSFFRDRVHPWLLILDNYERNSWDSKAFAAILPKNGCGAILLTTCAEADPELGTRETLRVYNLVTEWERREFYHAIRDKTLEGIVNALSSGFDPNNLSPHGVPRAPMINEAAEVGFTAAVQLMLDMGADPHLDKLQLSTLGKAAYYGHNEVVSLCLDHEDRNHYRLDSNSYISAFRYATGNGHQNVVKTLSSRRSDQTDIDHPAIREGIFDAAYGGHLAMFEFLKSVGKVPKEALVKTVALSKAIKGRNLNTARYLITELNINPNDPNDDGETAIFSILDQNARYIVEEEQTCIAILEMLITAGANPNVLDRGERGAPPLVKAIRQQLLWAVRPLLEHGADVNMKDDCDYVSSLIDRGRANALTHAVLDGFSAAVSILTKVQILDPKAQERYYTDALFLAAARGDRDLVLSVVKKADVDAIDAEAGDTALIKAIKSGHLPVARMLVRNHARLDIADKTGFFPLFWAAKEGMYLLVKDLVGQQNAPDLDKSDQRGNTALMLAVKPGEKHQKTVQALLKAGSDKDATNDYGETALDIAEATDCQAIIELLQE